ncbi:hypothetical protein F511_46855 [Dorcoceras hygrometricum]|uniref:Uncharacterized protein n=1 Tax=Dorcoceras hygrometricum TaxID=472368 RepID=A0A2Z6ZSJ6_9LAMI|nr:hypothetical protein F511_46855 [Dorcoceras hygrometricum]
MKFRGDDEVCVAAEFASLLNFFQAPRLICIRVETVGIHELKSEFSHQSTGNLATGLIFCLCATADIIVASGSLRLVLQLATG